MWTSSFRATCLSTLEICLWRRPTTVHVAGACTGAPVDLAALQKVQRLVYRYSRGQTFVAQITSEWSVFFARCICVQRQQNSQQAQLFIEHAIFSGYLRALAASSAFCLATNISWRWACAIVWARHLLCVEANAYSLASQMVLSHLELHPQDKISYESSSWRSHMTCRMMSFCRYGMASCFIGQPIMLASSLILTGSLYSVYQSAKEFAVFNVFSRTSASFSSRYTKMKHDWRLRTFYQKR